jgi:hypothetical protein
MARWSCSLRSMSAPICARAALLLWVGEPKSPPKFHPSHSVYHHIVRGFPRHGIPWKLWRHLFSPRVSLGRCGQSHVCCFNIQLRGSRQESYLWIPLPYFVCSYEAEWFYMRNPGGSVPQFTGRVPASKPEWYYGVKKKLAKD